MTNVFILAVADRADWVVLDAAREEAAPEAAISVLRCYSALSLCLVDLATMVSVASRRLEGSGDGCIISGFQSIGRIGAVATAKCLADSSGDGHLQPAMPVWRFLGGPGSGWELQNKRPRMMR